VKFRKRAAAQQTRKVVGWSNKSTQKIIEEEVGPRLPPEARKQQGWGNAPQLPGFRQKPDAEFSYAETVRDKYSTSRKCELEGNRERRTLGGTAGDRPGGVVTIKADSL